MTYHKIGPRPRGVRLKGLYLSRELFARQVGELKGAGWESEALDDALKGGQIVKSSRRVVVTFDDGFANVLENGLETLRQNNFRAIQFIVAGQMGRQNLWDLPGGERPERLMDETQIREWLAAGHQIGSHSLTHPFLTQVPLKFAREEVAASKKLLEDTFAVDVKHFCYPYGDWNPAVAGLAADAGYESACTTEFGVNGPGDSTFGLKRMTARYPSRNWANFKRWFRRWTVRSFVKGEGPTL